MDQAEGFFNKALEYDSAFAQAYSGLARVYWNKYHWRDYFEEGGEFMDTVIYLADMALSFDDELADPYTIKGDCYRRIGNRGQAEKKYDKAIDFNPNDWMAYRGTEWFKGNLKKAIEILRKGYEIDSTDMNIQTPLGQCYMFLGQNIKALKYMQRWIESIKQGNLTTDGMHRIGYVYWENGIKEESDYYFDKQIEYGNREIELGRPGALYYDLAGVYAFRGETEKAYENLRIFNQRKVMPRWAIFYFHYDPLFDSIRDEPEFQQIVHDVEAKYQAEHERVRQWLEENDR